MKKQLFFLLIFSIPFFANSQEKKQEDKIKLSLSGFVKHDMFWDTRQTVSAREGHFLLFPSPVEKDANGDDINEGMNFNFLSLQSRIALNIKGTEALGANLSGKIEGDFFAQANDNINLFRLRHAYMKLNWTNTELLFGQYWVPMFITDCFPGTVSFSTGVPFQPFGRSPQVRLTHKLGKVKLIAIANSQRDYSSRGDLGVSSSYLRNSAIPEISGQVHFKLNDAILFGFNASYKQIMPRKETDKGYKTSETIGGFNSLAFIRIKTKPITIKMQTIYGQNIPDVLSIGGFAVADTTDKSKGFVKYTTLNTFSTWADIQTNGKKLQLGIFAGYSKNMGANDEVNGPTFGLGTSIESLFRVSPRISYKVNKLKFALEGEYTVANYGKTYDNKAVPTDINSANNFRLLFSSYYFF